jgi:hypothetical protein
LHWKFAASVAENVKVAETAVVPDRGREPRVVSGAVASIVQPYDEAAPALPTASVGRTRKVWGPSPRPVYEAGELQGTRLPPSKLHWNADGSSAENVNVADLLLLSVDGPELTDAVGGRVSIVQLCDASGPVL